MQLINTVTVGSGGTSQISLTSIPNTFTDLVILLSARSNQGGGALGMSMRFNSDTGSNYIVRRLFNDGATITNNNLSGTQAQCASIPASSTTASTFGNIRIFIPNYAGSSIKQAQIESSTENAATFNNNMISITHWTQTAAITSVQLFPDAGLYEQNTSVSIYGITQGSGGATVS